MSEILTINSYIKIGSAEAIERRANLEIARNGVSIKLVFAGKFESISPRITTYRTYLARAGAVHFSLSADGGSGWLKVQFALSRQPIPYRHGCN